MKIPKTLFLSCFVLSVFATASAAQVGPTYAITKCKIITLSGAAIDKGIIIIRNGLIEAVGPEGKVPIPEDAEVIESAELIAYPGLINAHTSLFLEPPKEEPQPQMRTMMPEAPGEKKVETVDLFAFQQLKPKKTAMESFQKIGVTTVLVAPERGIFAGQSVLLNLNGEKPEPMVVRNPVALHINFTVERGSYPNSLMGTMAFLRQSFLDAEHYASYKDRLNKLGRGLKRLEYDPSLEALVPFVVEKKPIVFTCNNQEDIKRALRLAEEFRLNAILADATEAWRVADFLKKARVPLFISLNFKPPMSSIYATQEEALKTKAEKEIYPANASQLLKNGISFALTSHGVSDAATFLKNIQDTIKAGLPKEEALKALTITPAQFLKVDNCLGTIEPGKIANLILTSGELFEEKTQVKKVFVDGILFKMEKKPAESPQAKALALNIAGAWKVTFLSPMGEMEATMELEQEENQVKGLIQNPMGKWEIRDGVLSGNDLTFTLVAIIMGETREMGFSGKAEKDSIDGNIAFAGAQAPLRAIRIPKTNS